MTQIASDSANRKAGQPSSPRLSRKRSNEPVFWSLFGAGGVVTALLMPVLVLIIGFAAPLGLLGADAIGYERMLALAGSLVGKLCLAGVVSLTFWHACHRIYHSLHDLGFDTSRGPWALVSYGLAALGTIVTVAVLFSI